jgi:hypothetical protein
MPRRTITPAQRAIYDRLRAIPGATLQRYTFGFQRRDVLVTGRGYAKLPRGTIDRLEHAGLVTFGPAPGSWDSYWLPTLASAEPVA